MRGVLTLFSTILLFIPPFVRAARQRAWTEVLVGWPRAVNKHDSRKMFPGLHRVLIEESVTLFGHLLLIILHFLVCIFTDVLKQFI